MRIISSKNERTTARKFVARLSNASGRFYNKVIMAPTYAKALHILDAYFGEHKGVEFWGLQEKGV